MNSNTFLIIIIIIILFIIHRTVQSQSKSQFQEPFTKNSGNGIYQRIITLLNQNPNIPKCTLYNFLLQLHSIKQLSGFINYLINSKIDENIRLYNRIKKDAESILNPNKSLPSQNSCTNLIIHTTTVIDKYIKELNKNSQNIQFVDSTLDDLNEQEQLQELIDTLHNSKKQGKPLVSDALHVYVNDYYTFTTIVKSLNQENVDIVLDRVINNLSKNVLLHLTDYLMDSYNDGNITSKQIYDKLKTKYNSMSNKPFHFDFDFDLN
jgi:hypothetical protein